MCTLAIVGRSTLTVMIVLTNLLIRAFTSVRMITLMCTRTLTLRRMFMWIIYEYVYTPKIYAHV